MVRFKKALIDRGVALGELGHQMNLGKRTIFTSAAVNFEDSLSLRWRIEAHWGYAEAIWSSRDVLELRKLCHETTGGDPFLVAKSQLIALANRFGVRLTNVPRTVAGLRDSIIRHLAVNRHLLTQTKP